MYIYRVGKNSPNYFKRGTDKNERVHFNMGMLAMDDKNIEEAENWFRRAVHLKHDFRSALFNLALLLADDQRPLEAASFLNQLVKYHPDHTKGLILLGDIYINHVKDLDAAENVIINRMNNSLALRSFFLVFNLSLTHTHARCVVRSFTFFPIVAFNLLMQSFEISLFLFGCFFSLLLLRC